MNQRTLTSAIDAAKATGQLTRDGCLTPAEFETQVRADKEYITALCRIDQVNPRQYIIGYGRTLKDETQSR